MERAGVHFDDSAFQEGIRARLTEIKNSARGEMLRLAIQVQNEARILAPVDTGRLRASIVHTQGEDRDGLYAEIGTNVKYAMFVEFGTRYSKAQPYLRPAFAKVASGWRWRVV